MVIKEMTDIIPGGPKSDTLHNYVNIMQNTRQLYCLNNSDICY